MQSAINANDAEQDKTLGKDTIHEILSNSRRRAILRILDAHGPVDKGDLAELVAADEYGKPVDEVTSKERKRIYVSLIQQHLGKLEDPCVIDSNGTIRLTDNAEDILWHLRATKPKTLCETVEAFVRNLF